MVQTHRLCWSLLLGTTGHVDSGPCLHDSPARLRLSETGKLGSSELREQAEYPIVLGNLPRTTRPHDNRAVRLQNYRSM